MADSQGKQVTISGLDLIYRPLERAELSQFVLLAQDEGWSTTLEDAQLVVDAYADSFNGLFLNTNQSLVGVSSAMSFDETTAYVLYVVVNKSYQGRGLGSFLMKEITLKLKKHNIIVGAVEGTESFYERSGFHKTDLSTHFYSWSSPLDDGQHSLASTSILVKSLQDVDIEKLLVFDRTVHPIKRDAVMKARLSSKVYDPTLSKVALSKDGSVLGLAAARHTRHGIYNGPFYADNESVAKTLLQNIHCSLGVGAKLSGYSPRKNLEAAMTDLGISFQNVRKVTRMCTQTALESAWERVFCLCVNAAGLL